MPMSHSFRERLQANLPRIVQHFGTPFHIYDESGIRQTCRSLNAAFRILPGFREYFAVKALPNPRILRILHEEGCGFDCSSVPELMLAREAGAGADEIFFTSNNTTTEEFQAALNAGAILNLDDLRLMEKLPTLPPQIAFRYNPGARREGNAIIGTPLEAKFGLTHEQMHLAIDEAAQRGIDRFGLHAMTVSNELDTDSIVQTARLLFVLAHEIYERHRISLEFINLGGGFGIPYHPDQLPLNIIVIAEAVAQMHADYAQVTGHSPSVFTENGRYMTGPHGVLITRAINRKETYRTYIGVDASMSALMRPGIYGAYHHISVFPVRSTESELVDVIGSLCENNDKFAVQRVLPRVEEGDLLIIQDTGAHGHAMGFNYNGRLRPQELLLRSDGTVELIRRAEQIEDYFRTLRFEPNVLPLPDEKGDVP